MTDLSVLIPARNEEFLNQTIQDILAHAEMDTEIVVALDGCWPVVPVPDHPKVTLIYHPESRGQRASTNDACRIATGKYVMKCDAHCSFAQGFDRVLLEDMQPDWCVVPTMRNLHVFDWVCDDGHRRYQGPSGPCKECGKPTHKDIVWIAKHNPQSNSFCFDTEPHFQYFREFNKRPAGKGDLTETMSLQGSCWLMTRDKYWELDVCDESFGSWGSQGIEVAAKVWLSGGRVMVNHKTHYAHAFRTQGGDWGFPYPLSGKQVEHAKQTARAQFFDAKWDKAIHPLSWLVEKFWPVPGWTKEDLAQLKRREKNEISRVSMERVGGVRQGNDRGCDKAADMPSSGPSVANATDEGAMLQPLPVSDVCEVQPPGPAATKAILYYTDNRLDPAIEQACRRQLEKVGLPIVSVSIEPLDFGHNVILPGERGPLQMFRQILAGLEAITADVIFLCEHDVLYHSSHFDFTPPERDRFYYNQNRWQVDAKSGHTLHYRANSTSGLCAYRALLLEHYRKRVAMVNASGYSNRMGYEPGTHRREERVDDYGHDAWMSEQPNIDLRHRHNLTPTRWRRDQWRNQRFTEGWTESDTVPGWGQTAGRMADFLAELAR